MAVPKYAPAIDPRDQFKQMREQILESSQEIAQLPRFNKGPKGFMKSKAVRGFYALAPHRNLRFCKTKQMRRIISAE